MTRLWLLSFAAILLGASFQLIMQPELAGGAMTFRPDWSRAGDLLQGPGRLLGHTPGLFLVNAAILAGLFAVVFSKAARHDK